MIKNFLVDKKNRFLKNRMVFFSLVMSNFNVMIANNLIRSEQNMRLFVDIFKKYHDTIGCKRSYYEITCFLNLLLNLLNDNSHLDEKEGFFCSLSSK